MERYLRFYIKFHGYILAIGTIFGALFMAFILFTNSDFHFPLEEFYDFRFMGSSGILFGIIWLGVGISLLYGLIKEVKIFIFPFAVMYMLDLFLLFLRDIILIWQNKPWFEMVFVNPFVIPLTLFVTLHVMLSIVALGKLFEHDPLAQPGTNFVRFKTDEQRSNSISGADVGDEVSLVAE
ncbi:uncharacterized protein LOC129768760 [Toxorhynchites rutilus septentrionalis]|uniref:uncharacterized protein LOC129768760 n=1 Tax=Toxorhynchites rutilus septentrionalis TaxID=329112 RepID=UPI002478F481|nr:uncharacterized protein LOC129768760 [Toxorhynchites rutilus septentrionalis]